MGAAYADDIIQKLLDFQRKINALFDHISDGLYTDYTAADFIKERDELEAMLTDVEQQLKAGTLYALEETAPGYQGTTGLGLQESLQKIDAEIKEAHNLQQKLLKNTRTAAARLTVTAHGTSE